MLFQQVVVQDRQAEQFYLDSWQLLDKSKPSKSNTWTKTNLSQMNQTIIKQSQTHGTKANLSQMDQMKMNPKQTGRSKISPLVSSSISRGTWQGIIKIPRMATAIDAWCVSGHCQRHACCGDKENTFSDHQASGHHLPTYLGPFADKLSAHLITPVWNGLENVKVKCKM